MPGRFEWPPTKRAVLMLNKPRGLVTTAKDEQGRATVYDCLANAPVPWLAPIGRLDKASEGLLLFSNDPAWAALMASLPPSVLAAPATAVPRFLGALREQFGSVDDYLLGAGLDRQVLDVLRGRLLESPLSECEGSERSGRVARCEPSSSPPRIFSSLSRKRSQFPRPRRAIAACKHGV